MNARQRERSKRKRRISTIAFFFYTKHDYSSFVESSLSKISNSQKCNTHEETSGTSSFLQYDSRYIFSHTLGRSVPLSPIDGEDPLSDINKERGFLLLLLLMAYYDKSHGEHTLKNNRINVLACAMQSATCFKTRGPLSLQLVLACIISSAPL